VSPGLYNPGCRVEAVQFCCMSPDRSPEHKRASESSELSSAARPEMGILIHETSLSLDGSTESESDHVYRQAVPILRRYFLRDASWVSRHPTACTHQLSKPPTTVRSCTAFEIMSLSAGKK
jgi:hypothetical protein